jgi:hypothetical protein
MRTLAFAALLLLPVAGPAFAADASPAEIRVEVGQDVPLTGFRPICDDPSIATITAEGKGQLRALKVGETTCSVSVGSALGQRRIYRIVVVPPRAKGPDGKGGGEG